MTPSWDGKERRHKEYSGVDNLATFIRGEFKNFDTKLEAYAKRLEEHHYEIYGKEGSDMPGIKLKVDRLEQSKKSSDKHLGVVYTTAIALIFKSLWDWFSQK